MMFEKSNKDESMKKVLSVVICIVLGAIFFWRYSTRIDRVEDFLEKASYTSIELKEDYQYTPHNPITKMKNVLDFKKVCYSDSDKDYSLYIFTATKNKILYKGEVCCEAVLGIFENCFFIKEEVYK